MPDNMTLPDGMPPLDESTDEPVAEEAPGAPGSKPASKEDDQNYDEKAIPPPADYVEPVAPTEPNSNDILCK